MMMETVVYAREFLFMKELYEKGELGKLQFLQATHQQDMEGWPGYWPGLPPMCYATHCVGPILGLIGQPGGIRFLLRLRHHRRGHARLLWLAVRRSRPATSRCKDSDLSAQVVRSLFDVARQYRESFEVYGTKKSVEWPLIEHDPLVIHTAKKPEPEIPEEVKCPDFAHYLPEEIQLFTTGGVYGGDGGEDAPLLHPGRAATAAATRTSSISS